MLQIQIILGMYLLSIIASVVLYFQNNQFLQELAYALKTGANATLLAIILYILAWLSF